MARTRLVARVPSVSLASLIALAVALTMALATAPPAAATIVRPFALAELVRASHSIVRGQVVDREVVWDPDFHELYTLTWVRADEVLAGREQPGDLLVVRQIGGVLDGVERKVVGTAELELGDEVVLFARTDGTWHYLVGMAQGAFHISRSSSAAGASGPLVARPIVPSLAAPNGDPQLAGAAPYRPLAPDRARWDELRAEVLRIVAEVRAEARP